MRKIERRGTSIARQGTHRGDSPAMRGNATLRITIAGIVCLLTFVPSAPGQGLPNPGFEEWTPSGKPSPFNWEEPAGWRSTNAVTEFSGAGIVRSGTAHAGGLSCSIRTLNLFGSDAAGTIANGKPKLNFSTYSLDVMSGGTPFTGRPDKLSGYYRFDNSATDYDFGVALVILKKYNAVEGRADTIGIGTQPLMQVSSFTSFDVVIEYRSEAQPDSVIVAFFSTNPLSPLPGGRLLVDDIALVSDGSDVEDEARAKDGLRVYPNPALGSIQVELESPRGGERTILLYDLLGREVLRREFDGASAMIDLSLPEGMYAYRVIGDDEEFVGRIVVSR